VFVPAQLLWSGGAITLSSMLGRMLSRTGFYELVWHRALFDFAVFVILMWTHYELTPWTRDVRARAHSR
jgi:hypothetical protein